MEKLITFFSQKTFPVLIGIMLTSITLGTTGLSIIKASQSLASNINTEVPEVRAVNSEERVAVESSGSQVVAKSIPSTSPGKSAAAAPTTLNTSISPSQSTQVAVDNRCLVTLFGKQYDVTSLRSSHPGGNVFVCGTDMSATYQSAHGTDVSRMQQYLVTGNSTAAGTSSNSSSTSTGTNTGASSQSQTYHDDNGEEFEEKEEIEIKEENRDKEENDIEEDHSEIRSGVNWGTASSNGLA